MGVRLPEPDLYNVETSKSGKCTEALKKDDECGNQEREQMLRARLQRLSDVFVQGIDPCPGHQ